MTRTLPGLLSGFVARIRPLLGAGIELRLHVSADCPDPAGVDAEHLEAALAEMVRRVIAVMPPEGWLDLQARPSSESPEEVLTGAGAASPGAWLVLLVGSPQAGEPDQEWEVRPPRQNLARFASRFRGVLSVLPLEHRGMQLALYLPGTRHAGPRAGVHARRAAAPSTSGG